MSTSVLVLLLVIEAVMAAAVVGGFVVGWRRGARGPARRPDAELAGFLTDQDREWLSEHGWTAPESGPPPMTVAEVRDEVTRKRAGLPRTREAWPELRRHLVAGEVQRLRRRVEEQTRQRTLHFDVQATERASSTFRRLAIRIEHDHRRHGP